MRTKLISLYGAMVVGMAFAGGCGQDDLGQLPPQCTADQKLVDGVCVPFCDTGLERIGDACYPPCEPGYKREGTECVPICGEGFQWVEGDCLPICKKPFIYQNGDCVLICTEPHTVVSGEKCVCESGYELQGDDCVPICDDDSVLIGDVCVPRGAVSGRVCDVALGQWIAGAEISLTLEDGTNVSALTDLNGAFSLERLPPGNYYVTVLLPDGSSYVLPAKVVSGGVTTVGPTTCIPPPGQIRGAVCDAKTGMWVAGAPVTLSDGLATTVVTNSAGIFIFLNVAPGDYQVRITYPDGHVETRTVTVTSNQTVDLGPTVCLPPPGSLRGRVCDAATGAWIAGATAKLREGTQPTAVTGADGAFEFTGLAPGDYTVDITLPAGAADTRNASVYAGEITDIGPAMCLAPVGTVRGAVCDEATGEWLAGVTVSLNDAAGSTDTTDANGAYQFEDVLAGSYQITVNFPDGHTVVVPVTVEKDHTVDLGPAQCVAPDPCLTGTPTANAGPDQVDIAPHATVQLNGTGSSDPGGLGLTYSWRVAGRPSGSTAPLSSATSPTPTILADVSGEFNLCLIVTNSNGCISAEDCMKITVKPPFAFHAELVWDINNSDVDLHYMRPAGSWFDRVTYSDCFFAFNNMKPDWGPTGPDGLTINNPRLDVDNVLGYGPENINQDLLWDGNPFKVGAHYWQNWGGGQAKARVRIFIDGELRYEASRTLKELDFWEVADIQVSGNGTTVSITPNNNVFTRTRFE